MMNSSLLAAGISTYWLRVNDISSGSE